ncbi:MAG: hypothetical protein E7C50_00245 [Clostridium sp.]|uniref:hypothetical protein n=1 Tax=Clostridium sp. TaxID=1506 RepID=UPI002900F943|nr:hypothetical protein [Clostridium sp.]MDU2674010.1 hypothetical protein [Clostridium sp.]MDU2680288.1 hypothetical protein [Clostridium sp.]
MRRVIYILISIILMLNVTINATAYTPYTSDVYKQGVYEIGGLNEYNVSLELLNDTKTYALLVDIDNKLLTYLRLPYKEKILLKHLGDTETIAIIGPGEVAIIYEKK